MLYLQKAIIISPANRNTQPLSASKSKQPEINNLKNKYLILTFSLPFLALFFYFFVLNSPERQIKKTVDKYWTCIENNEFNNSLELFEDGQVYSGAMHMYFYKLRKNYSTIKPQITPIDRIQIKDTIIFGTEKKYVKYEFNNKNAEIKPIVLTFIFWKKTGFDKIDNPTYLKNFLDWDKKQ